MGLLSAFILGFGGSLHCLAMCGPLVMFMKFGESHSLKTYMRMLVYHSGRILVYATLGFVAGWLGWAVSLGQYHQWLSILMGSIILLSGLISFTGFIKLPGVGVHWFSKGMKALKKKPRSISLFLMGAMNGLLPCGLVYVAIGASVVMASPLQAALFMVLFGLGTTPLLVGIPAFQRMFNAQFNNTPWMRWNWKGILAIVAGCLLIVRGLSLEIPYVSPASEQKAGTTEFFCH